MDLDKYREDLAKFTDDQLAEEVNRVRLNLASYDKTYSELRVAGETPMNVTLESSQEARSQLRLAEREVARRCHSEYGSCPMDWPEENDPTLDGDGESK